MENYNDLATFALVAKERSFTRAAAKLGVSQSALSQTIRVLEEKLGLRLLTRTTRSVSPTEVGEQILNLLSPRLEEIETEIARLKAQKERPAGTLRITAGEHPAVYIVQPALSAFLAEYPDIRVELMVDYGLSDIVSERYDAGVRLGEQIAKDMIAVRISPDIRMVVVGSPDYFSTHPVPQHPQELTQHNCISIRLPTYGGIFPWEFEKEGREIKVRVDGQLVFNNITLRLNAALCGIGLAYIPEDIVSEHIAAGRLITVLQDWCPFIAGYHLYYPNRQHTSPAFTLLLNALRYKQ
ncbi:LysR family transcriptional regulator [Serratia fonticola]|jgi:DNA-binding transcriptional LysR family regulator|uniref:LysR family transcriptional regulator n=1 Tax=Serratia fonticola TaxID=47917 RepID=A0AAE7EH86_SERFO|nr:LysR family transcriptional regulator [Serratia fonticola]MBL5828201.1 LysR family transcriptional regulator [Serratia fonticola]MCO7510352.1 LysR family transcriptional regulator [Serratia fonticola]QKJ58523.1 LysR family transcriptional regulator [Serratia fonticola]WMT13044.1 LysR family transcriptional regulator [Serratia fonticola]